MTAKPPVSPSAIDTDQRPFVLVWEVTQACELACDHCRADARPGRYPDELTTEEGKRLLEEAADFGDGQLVVLSGGDPLLRDDLVDLVDYGTDLGLRMTLTPSGTTSLTREVLEDLKAAGLQRLALSIDGPKEVHDAFRGEEGSFRQTVDAAIIARELGLPVQINTTVCEATVSTLPAVRDLVAELDAVLWSVFFLVPVGRGRLLENVTSQRAESVLEWLDEISEDAPFGVKTTEAPHYRRVSLQRNGDPTAAPDNDAIGRRGGIIAGDGFAFVSHTGEVYPSGFLPKPAGDVREDGLVDTYQNAPLFQRLRDRDELQGKCGACEFRHVCGGSRSRAYAATGDPLGSDPLCGYYPEGYEPEDAEAAPYEG
ncbi:TIGR04053 family radical SAM/SPASM domain-containing protein [Natronomonas halophila]|uniref:TIGR04053 family radical SAM/SPASM domain-containing protein n=1 Tax=Natronomonas halophila TaxID=2747817 RepID=UPI0015B5D69D|nr:TIGR04053 family radical SAM/SPASM domain-containing protein [Natronomonas halophila]QLD85657.1 TIGR04053 family radical SAM/SPASM domain-containing protein [Natronomonas halophila]